MRRAKPFASQNQGGADSYKSLSEREWEVLLLGAEGLTDKEVGDRLGVTEGTIRTYWERTRAKMDTPSRGAAIAKVLKLEFSRQSSFRDALVRRAPVGIIVADPDGRLISMNDRAKEILRYEEGNPLPFDDKEGKLPFRAFHPGGAPFALDEWPLKRAISGHSVDGERIDLRFWDGTRKEIEGYSSPITDEEGNLVAGVVAFVDVTGRRGGESIFPRSLELFRIVAKESPHIVSMSDGAGRILYLNQFGAEFFGMAAADLEQKGWAAIAHTDDQARLMTAWESSLRSGNAFQGDFRLRRADGAYRSCRLVVAPIRSAKGEVIQWICSGFEVSEPSEEEVGDRS